MTQTLPTSTPSSAAPLASLLQDLPPLPSGLAALAHLGVIRARGEDAASFLQGQLSNDVVLLPAGGARLAAYCSAKGRVLASFIVYKQPPRSDEGSAGDILLICSRDLLAATLKRLGMFVLRAKVKLSDASAEIALHGASGPAAGVAGLAAQPWSAVQPAPGQAALRLYPAGGLARALLISEVVASPDGHADLPLAQWLWLDVLGAVPTVSAALSDQLVPQMLNYESTGGVSFKKGCYPGQEVVARSQFRGTLKRRLYLVRSSVPLAAGQDVLHGPDPQQVTGLVVQAAAVDGAAQPVWLALVSVQIAAAESPAGLYARAPDGQPAGALQCIERPYPLLEDI